MTTNKKINLSQIKKLSYKKLSLVLKVAGLCSVLSLPYSYGETVTPTALKQAENETSKQTLLALLKQSNFFSANFSQKVFDEQGNLLQQGKGSLAVKKPNLVNWHTTSPDELRIVSDGKDIWFYDPFIEQVTAYSFNGALANTPVLLLTSDEQSLWDKYTVSRVASTAKNNQLVSYAIQAKDQNSQIKRLVLSFKAKKTASLAALAQFTFEDATGQLSVIDLVDLDQQQVPANSLFKFSVPQGVNLDDQR